MSLINEALKKAQRQRNHPGTLGDDAGSATAHPIGTRGAPMRAQSVLVLFAAAAALIVLSVVLTVYLLTRPAPPPAAPAQARSATPPPVNLDTPSPVIVAPPLAPPPTPAVEPVNAAPAAATKHDTSPAGAAAVPSSITTAKAAAVASTASGSASVPSTPTAGSSAGAETSSRPITSASTVKDEVAVQTFVDAIRVTGIRSSGNESKVLMNDRVYRVNDIVERALGLKLIKVSSDALTFADPSGTIYVKNF